MSASAKNVDFSGVKDGGGQFTKKRQKEGDYLARIIKVEDAESKDDKIFMYLFTIKLEQKANSTYPFYCKIVDNQLWKLRNILIAAGKTVPKSKQKVDVNAVVGKLIGVTLQDTDYKDQEQSEIAGVFPAADLDDSDENTETSSDDEEEELEEGEEEVTDMDDDEVEEEADDEPADNYDDLDRAGLKAVIVSIEPGFQAKKSQTDDDLRTYLRSITSDTPSEADEDEEDDDDEVIVTAPAPAKKRTATKTTAKPKAADISDDELEEMDVDDL